MQNRAAGAVRIHPIYDAERDELIALEHGRVSEGHPADCWHPVTSRVQVLKDVARAGR